MMASDSPNSDEEDDDALSTTALAAHGFFHPDRTRREIEILMAALGLDGPERLIDAATATDDPDLAINGLDRAAHRLPTTERPQLATAPVLERVALLAGASEQLAEFSAMHLPLLAQPELDAERAANPQPFAGRTIPGLTQWHRGELLRICYAELDGTLDVVNTVAALSRLADATVVGALRLASREKAPPFLVVALGKWGGMELNYSSDIDLFFLREDDVDPEECDAIARRTVGILHASAADHLYRIDLRLRPGGINGPLVPSESQARRELEASGGTWERMVFIRARAVTGQTPRLERFLSELTDFTYRRPFHLAEIRTVKGYKGLLERSAEGRDRQRRHIKVGFGGIRDVEYVVQFLQLLHGGIYPEIRGGNVFEALDCLGRIGALGATETSFLHTGYCFLRKVEHRLMLRHRRQAFELPTGSDARRALARALGHDSWKEFLDEFEPRTEGIREILDRLLNRLFTTDSDGALAEVNMILAFKPEPGQISRVLAPLKMRDPEKAYTLLRRLAYPRRAALQSPRARQLLAHLFPEFLARLRETPDPDQAVLLFTNCVETLGAPATFYQLLADQPENCALFVDLFGRSRFLSDLLLDHPGILDEIVDLLHTGKRPKEEDLVTELADSIDPNSDDEAVARTLHEFRAIHTLHTAILDLGTRIPHQRVVKRLSHIARACLRVIDERCLRATEAQLGALVLAGEGNGEMPRHCILALGRLGGDEMGYGSDIDMILIYDGEARTEAALTEREFFTLHLQSVIATLTKPGSGGPLYPVDLRLRPRGAGGTLVHSLREFRDYLESPECQVWEHQALIRSSPVAGDTALGEELIDFIRGHIGRHVEADDVLAEMVAMHERRKEAASGEGFHIKTGPGALLDIEFLVQSAILLGLPSDPELWEPNTQRAIRLLASRGHFSDATAADLSTAYAFFRLVENRLSMLHRASVRVVATDDRSLRDLAIRIGYAPPARATPESYLLNEIRYHTERVHQLLEKRIGGQNI